MLPYLVMLTLVEFNKNYSHNHYNGPLFTSSIQALHAYRAKEKVSESKMAELSNLEYAKNSVQRQHLILPLVICV